jgi:hypothetical protein
MGVFETIVQTMADMNVFHLFFPWLLVLAATYGLLEKYEIFGDDSSINGVVALSLAFFAIGGAFFFAPEGIFTSFAAGLTFSIFGVLGLMIILGLTGYDVSEAASKSDIQVLIGAGLVVLSFVGAFLFSGGFDPILSGVEIATEEVIMPIAVLIFLMVIVAITTR